MSFLVGAPASQLHVWRGILKVAIASVMVGVCVGVDCQVQTCNRQSELFEIRQDDFARSVRRAGVEQHGLVTDKQVLIEIAVGNQRSNLILVREDFHTSFSHVS